MKTQGMFITPIFTTDLEKDYDLVNKLYDLKEKDSVGSPKSNVKGWHSKEDLYLQDDFKQITQDIMFQAQQCFDALSVEKKYGPEMTGLWAMINPPGARNTVHTHPLKFLSGVYYLKAIAVLADKVSRYHERLLAAERDLERHLKDTSTHCNGDCECK